jgi:membrane-bound ClpP family serine protease
VYLNSRHKRLILAIESGALVIVATWLLASLGRLYEPSAWLVALGLIAAGDIVTALVMERIAPTRVLLAPGETGHDSGTVVRGFGSDASGVIRIRGEFWRARSAVPEKLVPGDRVRVVQRQGLVLEVEPAEPGAA